MRHCRTGSGISMAYKSARQKAHEVDLDFALVKFRPEKPLSGCLELRFLAILPIPQSLSRKAREEILAERTGHTVKPDLDNLAKQLKDALTRGAFWHDDRQVVRMICEKRYGEKPCWQVKITRICGARK